MHPVLFNFGKITIYTYGFFVALAFLIAINVAKFEARRVGTDDEKIIDLAFYVLIAAIIGARLFFVIANPRIFIADPLEFVRIWNGGLVFYGGFITAAVTALVYLKRNGLPVWKTADIAAPALAIGHAVGRFGCFFAGCCYGKACDLPWAITFHHPDSLAPLGIPLHPTQLYSVANNFLIFIFLMGYRQHKKFEGQMFWLYVLIYGITRAVIEIFRGDFRGDFIFGILSLSQFVGLIMAVLAVSMLFFLSRRSSAAPH